MGIVSLLTTCANNIHSRHHNSGKTSNRTRGLESYTSLQLIYSRKCRSHPRHHVGLLVAADRSLVDVEIHLGDMEVAAHDGALLLSQV